MSDESTFSGSSNDLFSSTSIKTILKSVPAGLLILAKPDGRIAYVNDRAIELYGVDPRESTVKNHIYMLKHHTTDGEICPIHKLPARRALLTGEKVRDEKLIIEKPDGTRIYVNASAVPLTDEEGQITGAIAIFEDITERKKTEELYRTLLDASIDSFWLTNAEGRFLDVNKAFLDLSGYSREEILRMRISDFAAKETPEETAWQLQSIKENGSACFETLLRHKDGRIIAIQVSANYADIDGGRFFGFLHDITKRKRNEEAIKRSEERFRLIAEAAATMVYEFEVESGKVTVAYGLKELLGYEPEEIPLSNDWWFSQTHPEERLNVEAQLRRTIEAGSDGVFEYRIRHKRGDYIIVRDTVKTVKDDKGRAVRVVGGVVDITEARRIEAIAADSKAALEKERDLLQAVMNGAKNVHLVYLDRNFNFVRVNEAYAKTCGYKPEEMIGKNHFALYPDEENEAIFARVRDTGVPVEFHDRPFVFPDQPERGVTYWDWTLKPVKDGSGRVEGLVFSLVETTERKRAEEALRNSEEQFRRAIENAPIPVIMLAEDGEVLQINRAWTVLTGYEHQDMPFFDAWLRTAYGEDADDMRDHMRDLFTGKNYISMEFPIHTQDGAVRYWSFSASMLGTLQDKRRFAVGMAVDITQLKNLQQKLEQHAQKLEELVRIRTERLKAAERLAAIGETAGMVGHDIRNPLQSIIGELYLINDALSKVPDSKTKESLKESITVIEEQAAYINKIVTDLQDYAKSAAPRMEEVDVDKVIQAVVSSMDIPENIEFSYYVEGSFPKLRADASFLQRILTNLISNAVQAMPNGGKLTINASHRGEKALIGVEDTGKGIPEENREKLFKPLFTTKSKGQGFGLAVCKKLTEAMNGTITFESQKGKGTRFIIELPTT
ncbi:MAG: PAS domain S-box protein [Candidatus Bathyarchaeota archaeon]|nr:PAS domain S-box protein [Candidatus Bathyarchaeota archaeon]